eukprot:TRINITY_DN40155_c0_g1_i1.p1 TRINITY_DN40155_c0_g1~~TRINITY_DN40155_c0_g1_i1.p1  ORF type:complete len:569 (+),score=150.93 TRINITY_DN40155_c0_g1_i1:511-2217(+)
MTSVFNEEILAEKLSKLNNSQQSIETLSHWCIFHRKKAKQVVETWDKQFHISQKEQRVPFLYLANDILQNSRRKGNEFVVEFWNVLPAALKDLCENGDEYGKKVVFRLVDIWENRKVFGPRSQSLREEMLGKDPPPPLLDNAKSSHSHYIKIVKKSPRSVRIKLAVGGTPEKIISAFQAVHDGHNEEDVILNKCKDAVKCVERMDKDVEQACETGNIQNPNIQDELQEQENILKDCIEHLGNTEKKRVALVSQLKAALQDQESKLELVRTQLQVAQGQLEQAGNMRQRLRSVNNTCVSKANGSESQTLSTHSQNGHVVTEKDVTSTSSMPAGAIDNQHKKTAASVAAEVAAKLAASTSSAQMLTSVLSSFAAEEAASISNGLQSTSLSVEMPAGYPSEKRIKVDNQFSNGDNRLHYMVPVSHSQTSVMQHQPPLAQQFSSVQPQHVPLQHQVLPASIQNQASSVQHPGSSPVPQQPLYPPPAPPPPPPLSVPSVQYITSNGSMVGAPYGYNSALPPPPSLQVYPAMGIPGPGIPQQSSSSAPYQQLQPPGMGFYSQSSMSSHPSVPPQ